ncbi:uncharacterized protein [Hetaerina americana]|uniref:uncharacterized protein n=1 Tax=Hetaerina americana TaxID=62018 RepID=UPI003A7F22B3
MCPSKYDCSVGEYSSVVETCRLCLLAKKSYVDIFSMTTRDGCPLVEKLNESFGIQAFLGDELPRCVCIDCLRHVRRGNISYCLWSTLDYLIRMEEDNEKLTSSFHIPKEDTLDFLFNDGEKMSPASSARQKNDNCAEMGVVEPDACGSSEGASGNVAFEYCWCPECNAEFLSREELRTHRKTHAKSASVERIGVEMEPEVSFEEIGLLSGELSFLRSKLCCGKCGREFRDEGRLVAHINKHDFKCKPRNFEVLNAMLMDLRSIRSKSNALRRSTSEDLLRRVDSTCAEGGRSLWRTSLSSVAEERSSLDEELTSSRGGGVVKGHFKTGLNESGSRKSSTDVRPKQSAVDLNEGEFRKENCSALDKVSSEKSLKTKELSLESKLNGSPPALLISQRYEKSTNGSNVESLFYCDYCSKPSESKSTLRKHIVMCHLSMEVHKCTVCHFVFPTFIPKWIRKSKLAKKCRRKKKQVLRRLKK